MIAAGGQWTYDPDGAMFSAAAALEGSRDRPT
jgi:hypothetical protein